MRNNGYPRDTGYLLNKAARRWNTLFVSALARRGVTDVRPSFGAILVPLFQEDGLRLGELANRAGLSKQTVTGLIRRVESLGYIERRADPEDGRAARVYLTARGRRMKGVVRDSVAELQRTLAGIHHGSIEDSVDWLDALSRHPAEHAGS